MDERISVHSVTGIDLMLTIAGPGNRSYAFVIDWHVRLLLSGAWLLLASYAMRLSVNVRSEDALISVLPALVIYFLYHPILEVAMHGRTPGKRIAGLRIVTRTGGTPGVTALLIRNLFRLIDSLPALYALGLIACFVTPNRVRIGDMAAGTLLVLDEAAAAKSLARLAALTTHSALPLDKLELVDQVLGRWESLESENRRLIAATLLAHIQPGTDAKQLADLSDSELHARLRALLTAGVAVSGG